MKIRLKWGYRNFLIVFTVAVAILCLILFASCGISRCHQQAAQSCSGPVKTVSTTWGVACSYTCF